ncbi:hypothetical protein HJC23_013801 [Cyclotella cryptica]|uniref:Fe2OG dioxygenase domain-containing protein n=1 Tax=Cyclotella cryptica TaxID=29204 RepID=A0ABD3PFJ8_9STRA|eukprot:CCRYP_014960-RA/>CCRYP_014960-RA protein AED:0.20 eAED:0.20 QI:0/-1/0/1/-1/1/1/0/362
MFRLVSSSTRPCLRRFRLRSVSSVSSDASQRQVPCRRNTASFFSASSCTQQCRVPITVRSVRAHQEHKRQDARHFSSDADDIPTPTISAAQLQDTLLHLAPSISHHLATYGYYTTTNFLQSSSVSILRSQAITLRKQGRYEQSYSEKLEGHTIRRFDKRGVYACEPDGRDYYTAPDLITYIATLLRTLPEALNGESFTKEMDLSPSSFNAKLAVSTAGGSRYPCHIDNPVGNDGGDVRKLTCILYLNPGWVEGEGGEIRLFVKEDDGGHVERKDAVKKVDLSPVGGRLLLFWSDEIPHEVLTTKSSVLSPQTIQESEHDLSESTYSESDRYALTVWIPTENRGVLHDERSKFVDLKDLVQFG